MKNLIFYQPFHNEGSSKCSYVVSFTFIQRAIFNDIFFSDIIESRKEGPLLRLLTTLGGWPVIMGDDWIPEAFDWQETIAKLRQFNNDILVAIWVGPDGKDSEKNIVQVSLFFKNLLQLIRMQHF